MKITLPVYGVQVVEVPRLKIGEKVVSASEVRKFIRGRLSENYLVKKLKPKIHWISMV